MGCARSKTGTKDELADDLVGRQDSSEAVEDGMCMATDPSIRIETVEDALKSAPFIDFNTEDNGVTGEYEVEDPIETVFMSEDGDGGSTMVLRTGYGRDKRFNNEETIDLLKDEAFTVLTKEIKDLGSIGKAYDLIKNSYTTVNVDNSALSRAVTVIYESKAGSWMQLESLLRIDGDLVEGDRRKTVDQCLRSLLLFAEDRASKNSLLRVLQENLEQTSGEGSCSNVLDSMQLDARERETVHVTVTKSVKHRLISVKELESRGIAVSDVVGKDIFIVTKPPEDLDEIVQRKANELMKAAGSIYNSDARDVTRTPMQSSHRHNLPDENEKLDGNFSEMKEHKDHPVSSKNSTNQMSCSMTSNDDNQIKSDSNENNHCEDIDDRGTGNAGPTASALFSVSSGTTSSGTERSYRDSGIPDDEDVSSTVEYIASEVELNS